jgi:hypothetical protein
MSVPVWPSQVPYENEVSGSGADASFLPPIESETEGGPSLSRPRPGPRATNFAWRSQPLTGEEWEALDQFLRVSLVQGSLVFQMPVFRPGAGYVSRKCKIKGGSIVHDFGDSPNYRVSFTLIVFNW